MRVGDQEYFARRLAEESAAAGSTPCPEARRVHTELADLYSDKLRLIQALDSDPTFSEPRHPALARRPA